MIKLAKFYDKNIASDNLLDAFIFTENAEMLGTAKNVSTTQAVIRTDTNGNINKNALPIVTKKFQVAGGDWLDTDDDFKEFVEINNKLFENIITSNYRYYYFPESFGTGKAKMPNRFVDWLQAKLEDIGVYTKKDKGGLVCFKLAPEKFIYHKLSENNIVLNYEFQMNGVQYAKSINGVFSLRLKNKPFHFGNPFSPVKSLVIAHNLVQTESTREAVEKYISWVIGTYEHKLKGINIRSDKNNPNSLSNRLTNPVWYSSKEIFDVETEYKRKKSSTLQKTFSYDDALIYDTKLMTSLIIKKFEKTPSLIDEINNEGGLHFLQACSHITGATNSRWEGFGLGSRFIQVLCEAYTVVATKYNKYLNVPPVLEPERLEWIKNILKSGQLKGKPIVYYKDLKEHSHASALDFLINKYFWETNYTNHSGGAIGADIAWDTIGREYGVTNHIHYYHGQKTPHGNTLITKIDELCGQEKVTIAARQMGRIEKNHEVRDPRLIRNWSQVKYADAIFAITTMVPVGGELNYGKKALIRQGAGGTGYAIQMAINEGKPVYVFDQILKQWFKCINNVWSYSEIPTLTVNFAGIGTRNINEDGLNAIHDVYKKIKNI